MVALRALRDIVSWIKAAEGAAATAERSLPVVWRAELRDVQRELEQLERRAEKLASEVEREEKY